MKALLPALAIALLAVASYVHADQAKKKTVAPAKPEAVFLNETDVKWGEGPPTLPKGAQLAVLEGDPAKAAPYAMRLKMPAGYKIPGHWHTRDEQLTIVSGTFLLHMGDDFDAPAHELQAGGFHYLPGGVHHAAEVKGETVVQITGIGPFDIHYLNPKDDPTKATKAAGSR